MPLGGAARPRSPSRRPPTQAARYQALHPSEALELSAGEEISGTNQRSILEEAERRLSLRLLPWLVLLVMASFIDRTNLAFASISMMKDLGMSNTVYGLGSGLFFLGYAFFQVSLKTGAC